jgi:hypothetical protein
MRDHISDVKRGLVRRLALAALGAALLATIGVGGALAGGPPSIGFYVDGALYRTVGTPTDPIGSTRSGTA